jgi:regulator of protease activity HflC (stomatin/prohibitin superfamily)
VPIRKQPGAAATEQLGEKGSIVEQFLLRDVAFTPEYAAAIERKQVALEGQEQALHEAEQVRNRAAGEGDRLRIEAEGRAQAILQEAEAQAEALRMLAAPLEDNASLLTYRYIERLARTCASVLVPQQRARCCCR